MTSEYSSAISLIKHSSFNHGHLKSVAVPSLLLKSTNKEDINLKGLPGITVVYIFPRASTPLQETIDSWDSIEGAKGCSIQSKRFADDLTEMKSLGANALYGLSNQSTIQQEEIKHRLKLPFELLSDNLLTFANALGLPRFQVKELVLLRRITLILNNGKVIHSIYPIEFPEENSQHVIAYLKSIV